MRPMRSLPAISAATALAATTLVMSTATSASANDPSATVSPSSVTPGSRVSLNLQGCGTKTGRASSSAFGDVILQPGNLEATNLVGAATVYDNASPGSHQVRFMCGIGSGVQPRPVTINVVAGPARGGVGGSMSSVNPAHIAIGGTLVAGAMGAGVWVLRRRAESRI
ncbi:hypothetical protein [Streptomyces sp. NPDC006879]|uniref:hypothetical protein n=1 Tax=Streptomyces sp. NPDC006879 TaxID=3364767 RepID=UPI00367AF5E8